MRESNFELEDKEETVQNGFEKDGNETGDEEKQKLHDDLQRHFSDPFTRIFDLPCFRRCGDAKDNVPIWRACLMGVPWKFTVIILKLVFCTSQLVIFANQRMEFVNFLERNTVAMKHLLLKDWTPVLETPDYPPNRGPYAIYRINELLDHINYTVNRMNDIPRLAAGSFFLARNDFSTPVTICVTYFKSGRYDRDTKMLSIDDHVQKECRDLSGDYNTTDYGFNPRIEELIRSPDGRLVRLLYLSLKFTLVSIHVSIRDKAHMSKCFKIDGDFQYDNWKINGQILVDLLTEIQSFPCQEDSESLSTVDSEDITMTAIVLPLSLFSIILSTGNFIKSIRLCKRTRDLLDITTRETLQVVKIRDLLIVIGDVLTIVGTIIKVLLHSKGIDSSDVKYDACAVCLGIGCLLVWLTVLHYFSYDRTFYLLFEVIEKAAMTVSRFVACSGVLFIGFGICGWAVLGPYHLKFETMSSTFKNLLGTLNGDELYITLTSVASNHKVPGYFNVIYNSVFVFVYTLIALNIFIAILNTSYEHLRSHQEEIKGQTALQLLLKRKRGEPLMRFRREKCPFSSGSST